MATRTRVGGKDIPPGLALDAVKWHETDRRAVDATALKIGQVITGFDIDLGEFSRLEEGVCKSLDWATRRSEGGSPASTGIRDKPLGGIIRPKGVSTVDWRAIVFRFRPERLRSFHDSWGKRTLPERGLTLWLLADRKEGSRIVGSVIREATYYRSAEGVTRPQVMRATSRFYIVDQPGGMKEAITGKSPEERGSQAVEYALEHVYGKVSG